MRLRRYTLSFLFLLIFPLSLSFLAYDCNNPQSIGIFGLKDQNTCSNIIGEIKSNGMRDATIVQMPGFYMVKARMLISERKTDYIYCTYSRSRTMRVLPESYSGFDTFKITTRQGRQAMHTGRISIGKQTVELELNSEHIILDSTGIDSEGYCITYSIKLEVTIYKFKLLETEIKVVLNNKGEYVKLSNFDDDIQEVSAIGYGYLQDGTFIGWDPIDIRSCPWEKVYTGESEEFISKHHGKVALFKEIGASFILRKQVTICKNKVTTTNDERIFLIEGNHLEGADLYSLSYGSWRTLILSTVQFVENLQINLLNNITTAISYNECKLNAKIMKEIIYGSVSSPSEIGYRLTGKLGTMAVVSGEALQILMCKGVEVKLRESNECYTEIPVSTLNSSTYDRKELFMDPVTKVVTDSSSILSCADIRNPYFTIRGQWYKMGPRLLTIPTPKKLGSLRSLKTMDIEVIKGLYPHEVTDTMEGINKHSNNQRRIWNKVYNTINRNENVEEQFTGWKFGMTDVMHRMTVWGILTGIILWCGVMTATIAYLFCSNKFRVQRIRQTNMTHEHDEYVQEQQGNE